MAKRNGELIRRRWADVVVIVIGTFEVLLATFGPALGLQDAIATDVPRLGWFWAAPMSAGVLAITAVLVALRNTTLARVLCAAAGVVLLTTLFAYTALDARSVLLFILPAVLLLAATPFLGPMPTPEEEGERR